MTTRNQILRSSTPGAQPAAGTRQPGELWTTFPDLQLGVIDASRNAQRLVAVRYFSTTANYVVGDFVIQAGVLYAAKVAVTAGAFNATQWTQIAAPTDAGGPYLSLAGGTLTGALVLNADPGAALGAATKQYVDGKVSAAPFLPLAGGTLTGKLTLAGPPTAALDAATKAYVDSGAFMPVAGGANTGLNDNRLINGDMRIDQRNGGTSGTAAGYMVDRWAYGSTQAGKFNWGRNYSGLGVAAQFPYYLGASSTSAYASLATDQFNFNQPIEADTVSDFAWGTVNAQSATFSFWAYSNLTGTFGGAIRNYPIPSTRSYPFTFSIPVASTWTKIAITIPGDTAGTWVMSGNAAAFGLSFDLGCGANFRGPANAWASANYQGATGAVSIVGTNGAFFGVTGVKLEIGSVATPYNRQSLAKSMADCQRYYQTLGAPSTIFVVGYGATAGAVYTPVQLPVVMRAAPTVSFGGIVYGNASAITTNTSLPQLFVGQVTVTATGGISYAAGTAFLNAEL